VSTSFLSYRRTKLITNMKATISFDLDDAQDAQAHFRCVKALDMALAIWTFSGRLRRLVDDEKGVDAFWEEWEETMEEYGIKMDDLLI
jgi:hypothetical protein